MKSQTISDDALQKATGKKREEWFTLLKKIKAQELSHKDIARRLQDEYNVDGWWAQSITVGFERTIGRREVGQTSGGDFQAAASKTLPGNIDGTLKVWQNHVKDLRDFGGVTFSNKPGISKTDKWRYWRVNLTDGSKITLVISQKTSDKIHLAINHEKLSDQKTVKHWKAYWKDFISGLSL